MLCRNRISAQLMVTLFKWNPVFLFVCFVLLVVCFYFIVVSCLLFAVFLWFVDSSLLLFFVVCFMNSVVRFACFFFVFLFLFCFWLSTSMFVYDISQFSANRSTSFFFSTNSLLCLEFLQTRRRQSTNKAIKCFHLHSIGLSGSQTNMSQLIVGSKYPICSKKRTIFRVQTRGKLLSTWNRQCPGTNIQAYFCANWRLLC